MSSEEKTTNVVQRIAQPFRVQLTRGQRGTYGWQIEVQGEDRDTLLYQVDEIDSHLKGRYLQPKPNSTQQTPRAQSKLEDPLEKADQVCQHGREHLKHWELGKEGESR